MPKLKTRKGKLKKRITLRDVLAAVHSTKSSLSQDMKDMEQRLVKRIDALAVRIEGDISMWACLCQQRMIDYAKHKKRPAFAGLIIKNANYVAMSKCSELSLPHKAISRLCNSPVIPLASFSGIIGESFLRPS